MTAAPFPFAALDWEVGRSRSPDETPSRFVPATVPGAVQLDWAAAHGWPSLAEFCDPAAYAGLEDDWWHYRAKMPAPSGDDRESWLVLCDIDHQAIVRADGLELARGGGMGRTLEVRLPEGFGGTLTVVVLPAPKEPGQSGRAQALRTTKAAVSYGWDFHPVLIPLGLAGLAGIEWRPADHLAKVSWSAHLTDDLSCADWQAVVLVRGHGELAAELRDPVGRMVWQEARQASGGEVVFSARVEGPALWWPRGHGSQDLYTFRCSFAGGPVFERRVGFRRVRLVMAPGQWDQPARFPKSRSRPPFTLQVNGRRIFAKGANVVGPDVFPGRITPERWRALVARAVDANMNVLRVWGGAPIPGDSFFSACDESGMMVVQEFPLACNPYPDDPAYLEELSGLAQEGIERLAWHPSLVLWSGGNELFNAWSGMTDQSHAVRLLNSLCWLKDPDTPFVPTLPIEGVGHGFYLFRDPRTGEECFSVFQNSDNTAYTEFGVPGPSGVDEIRRIVPEAELWPPRETGTWRVRSGCGAWDVEPTSWMCLSTIEHYWGSQESLESAVEKGHWLNAEGHRGIIEEARRQWPQCGWALIWCLNEPWPTVANQSLIAWPDHPKPSFDAVRSAFRPTVASARISRFQWMTGETFEADLWVLHDAPCQRPAVVVRARLRSGDWESPELEWAAPSGEGNVAGPTFRMVLPELAGDELCLELVGAPFEASNHYRLAVARKIDSGFSEPGRPRGLNA